MSVKITCGDVTVGRFVDDKITLPCNLHYMPNNLEIEYIAPSKYVYYTLREGAYYECSSSETYVSKDLEIAEEYDNLPVRRIGGLTFRDRGLTSVVIPNTITEIGGNAFSGNDALTSVTFGKNSELRIIEEAAFVGCSSLTSFVIPSKVTSIGEYAFNNCTMLSNIAFNGTISEWNTITKGSYWNGDNGKIPATHVQCTDGTVAL